MPLENNYPDIENLRKVIDYIIKWTGSLEVDKFSTGNRYFIQTPKLAISGNDLRKMCESFLKDAERIESRS